MEQPILGTFFFCGDDGTDFTDLPVDKLQEFMERFWMPERMLVSDDGAILVIREDDGTLPE